MRVWLVRLVVLRGVAHVDPLEMGDDSLAALVVFDR